MERREYIEARTWRIARIEITRIVREEGRFIELRSLKRAWGPNEEGLSTYEAHFTTRER